MYYLVAYGHAIRCEKGPPSEAMRLAFGLVDPDRMTLLPIHKMPRNMSRKDLDAAQRRLAVRHFHRTGSVVSGFEKEPGIANVHWTSCQLCQEPITTEPASKGVDNVCCPSCENKLPSQEEMDQMSVNDIRRRLGVEIHQSDPVIE